MEFGIKIYFLLVDILLPRFCMLAIYPVNLFQFPLCCRLFIQGWRGTERNSSDCMLVNLIMTGFIYLFADG